MRDIKKMIRRMTLEEKAGICSGKDFWHLKDNEAHGIPLWMVTDGPHGLRKQLTDPDHLGVNESVEAVCFPAGSALACSFDEEMMEELGETLGEECRAEDVAVLLGPAINIKRTPLGGRNFEYLSEDPYLTGTLAAAYVRGVQNKGVGVSVKHFAANNQETGRMFVSAEIEERPLREIYLKAFEMVVKEANPWTIMCSYNKLNAEFASQNRRLLTDILREEWGFEGYVMSDWGAVTDRVKALEAGLDLEMPASGGINDARLAEAVKSGILQESTLDRAVERILNTMFRYTDAEHSTYEFDREKHHQKAVNMAVRTAVLLKNEGDLLPLDRGKKIAYIGEFAKKPRYQGGGSSHVNPHHVSNSLVEAQKAGISVTYAHGFDFDTDEIREEWIKEAAEAAREAECAVIFAGLPEIYESEGYDRDDLSLPKVQNQLIAEVSSVQPNVIVILHNGSPVDMPWIYQVPAVLELYLAGEGVGEATHKLLYGEVSPSGKLAETFPVQLSDTPAYLNFPGDKKTVHYREGIYVGYRYYDKKQAPVLFPFGHGLTYTTFHHDNMCISRQRMKEGEKAQVSIDVTNTGKYRAKETLQLYIGRKDSDICSPVRELKGIKKVELHPGETKKVVFEVEEGMFSFYHEESGSWQSPSGQYVIGMGSSSREIHGELTIEYHGATLPFWVDMDTPVADLLNHPVTAPVILPLLPGHILEESGKKKDFTMKMLRNLPVRGAVTMGFIKEGELMWLIRQMNELLCPKEEVFRQ